MKRFISFALLYLSALLAGLWSPTEWQYTVWICAALFVTSVNMICAALEAIIEAAHSIAKGGAA